MTDPTPEQFNRLVNSILGENKAFRLVLTTLIASHPRPDLVQSIWNHSKPEWIDQMEAENAFKHEDYQTAFLRTLSAFTQSIDEAELVTRPNPPA